MNIQANNRENRKHPEKLPNMEKFQEADAKNILMTNSIYYFLEFIFILIEHGTFRLVVLQHNRLLMDRRYKSLRGAKIAFSKYYTAKRWQENIEPDWSPAYHPEVTWLEEKLTKNKEN